MPMTKQKAFYKWLDECPIEFEFQMDWENSKDPTCTDEMYIFRSIPNAQVKENESNK